MKLKNSKRFAFKFLLEISTYIFFFNNTYVVHKCIITKIPVYCLFEKFCALRIFLFRMPTLYSQFRLVILFFHNLKIFFLIHLWQVLTCATHSKKHIFPSYVYLNKRSLMTALRARSTCLTLSRPEKPPLRR